MKSLKVSLLAGAMLMAAGTVAQAADADVPADTYQAMGFYLRGDLGWSFLDWTGGDNDDALAAGGGVGYKVNDNLRTDLRLDWAGDYEIAPDADMSITTVLGNLYFDMANDTMFTPYLGAGAGYGWTSNDGAGGDEDGVAFALMAGVGVDVTENLTLDLGYRLRDVMVSGSDPNEHQILGGVRFGF